MWKLRCPAFGPSDAASNCHRTQGHFPQGKGLWANFSDLRVVPHCHDQCLFTAYRGDDPAATFAAQADNPLLGEDKNAVHALAMALIQRLGVMGDQDPPSIRCGLKIARDSDGVITAH